MPATRQTSFNTSDRVRVILNGELIENWISADVSAGEVVIESTPEEGGPIREARTGIVTIRKLTGYVAREQG